MALKPLVTASELEAPKVLPSLKLESGTPTHLGIVETSPKVPSAGVGEVSEFKPIDVGGGGGGGGGGPPTRLVPDTAIVVRGGTGALPPPGTVFSGAYGPYALTVEDAAAGVPHGTIRVTTAGDIRLGGGTVVAVPELTSTKKARPRRPEVGCTCSHAMEGGSRRRDLVSEQALIGALSSREVGARMRARRSPFKYDVAPRQTLYEEYFAFGMTSFHSASGTVYSDRRYRYNGKERDEETGLYYYGARYYAAWLGRWTSCDSSGEDGPNRYSYVGNRPISLKDPNGESGILINGMPSGKAAAQAEAARIDLGVTAPTPQVMQEQKPPDTAQDATFQAAATKAIHAAPAKRQEVVVFSPEIQKGFIDEFPEAQRSKVADTLVQTAKQVQAEKAAAHEDWLNTLPSAGRDTGGYAPPGHAEQRFFQDLQAVATSPWAAAAQIESSAIGESLEAAHERIQAANQVGDVWLALGARPSGTPRATKPSGDRVQYSNIRPQDTPVSVRRFTLEERGGKWVTVSPTGATRTARGTYDFVAVGGRLVVGPGGRGAMGKVVGGHINLAHAEPVDYAGQVTFSSAPGKRGVLQSWSNASGHYKPDPDYAGQAGLPLKKFVPIVHRGSGISSIR